MCIRQGGDAGYPAKMVVRMTDWQLARVPQRAFQWAVQPPSMGNATPVASSYRSDLLSYAGSVELLSSDFRGDHENCASDA
jgi:hypothetical protein